MARERTYFKQISLFRARYIYVLCNRLPLISGCVRVSTYLPAATTTSRRDATRLGCLLEEDCACPFFLFFLSFLPRVAEFKRFKAISLGVADRCWSTADWASPSSIRLVSPRFFSVSKFLSNYDRVTMMLFLSPFFMEVIIYSLWLSFTASTIYLSLCKLLFMFVQASRRLLHRLVLLPKSRRLSR